MSKRRPGAAGMKIEPLLKPVVEPVIERLDRLEALVEGMKQALEVQFTRTAEIQAQLDRLLAQLAKK